MNSSKLQLTIFKPNYARRRVGFHLAMKLHGVIEGLRVVPAIRNNHWREFDFYADVLTSSLAHLVLRNAIVDSSVVFSHVENMQDVACGGSEFVSEQVT